MKVSSKFGWLGIAFVMAGCVGTELEAPANHPGHPAARSGRMLVSTALGPELDVHAEHNERTDSGHAGHVEHPEHQHEPATPSAEASSPRHEAPASATYTCPMHPEIVRKEPGSCPICGMKLVPKAAKK